MKHIFLLVVLLSSTALTNAQVSLVKQINPVLGMGSYPKTGVAHNNISYFWATDTTHGEELWRSDGTESGTYMLIDLYPGPNSASGYDPFIWGDDLYLLSYHHTSKYNLWKISTVTEQATIIKNFDGGPFSAHLFGAFTVVGNHLYFIATESQHGAEIWKTDGTPTGTTILKDIVPGPNIAWPFSLCAFNGKLYFLTDFDNGLWESDGSTANTIRLNDMGPSSEISIDKFDILVPVKHGFFFTPRTSMYGRELWFSDGTTAGTHLVKDIDPAINNSNTITVDSRFGNYGVLNNRLVFSASPGQLAQIWISDGTEAGFP